jgi:hypothetical protein
VIGARRSVNGVPTRASRGGVGVRVGVGISVGVDVSVGVKVIVGVRVVVFVPVNVGEGVLVATSAEKNAEQAIWLIRNTTTMNENNKIFLFMSI